MMNQKFKVSDELIAELRYRATNAGTHYADWGVVLPINAAELAGLCEGARWARQHGWSGTVELPSQKGFEGEGLA